MKKYDFDKIRKICKKNCHPDENSRCKCKYDGVNKTTSIISLCLIAEHGDGYNIIPLNSKWTGAGYIKHIINGGEE